MIESYGQNSNKPEIVETSSDLVNKNKLNIGIISEASVNHTSGVTRSVAEVTKNLIQDGHDVKIMCPGPAPDEFAGAEVITTKSYRTKGFDVGSFSEKKFHSYYENNDFDVLHIASPMDTPGGLLFIGGNAIRAANNSGIPTTAIYQTDAVKFSNHLKLGITAPVIRKILGDMHNQADINLVPSTSSVHDLLDFNVRPESIKIWTRGVDLEAFHPSNKYLDGAIDLREQLAPNGEIIFGSVSRLEPEKRLAKLAILNEIDNARLLVVGSGTDQTKLEKKLGKQALFTGMLSGEKLSEAYGAIDAFILPSISETFAQSVQEAKASGIPVISANRGGPKDLIEHGINGYLYEPNDKNKKPDRELLEYGRILTEDQELRSIMGIAARSSVEHRSWDNLVKNELVDYYRQAISSRHNNIGKLVLNKT